MSNNLTFNFQTKEALDDFYGWFRKLGMQDFWLWQEERIAAGDYTDYLNFRTHPGDIIEVAPADDQENF